MLMEQTIDMPAGNRNAMPGIVFTDASARKVQELVLEEGNPDLKLRVYISGGGCSGFQYGFTFDEEQADDDIAIDLSLIHISEPTRQPATSRMPSSA